MPTFSKQDRRHALEALGAERLRGLAGTFGLAIEDRRSKSDLAGALADARRVAWDDVLAELGRTDLRAMCAALGIVQGGRELEGYRRALSRRAMTARPRPRSVPIVAPKGRATRSFAPEIVSVMERDNPWWRGEAMPVLPQARRTFVDVIHRRLEQRLAPIVVVRGPRQVGKTTAQLQVISDLLARGINPRRIFRVQADDLPGLSDEKLSLLGLADWYEHSVLGRTMNAAAQAGEPSILFLDEVQNLADWDVQLKHLVDGTSVQVVVTGSSALRIERGRDSLAGRIHTVEVGTLTLREISAIRHQAPLTSMLSDNGLDRLGQKEFWLEARERGRAQAAGRDAAFASFSARGGYPLVHARAEEPWSVVADQLNETVIERVIQHDLRIGDRGRKRDQSLLEELFRLACRYAGQTPGPDTFVREVQRALGANVGVQRVRHYLDFLNDTLLLRLVRPLEIRLRRTKGHPKICLADHGLRASWLGEEIPLDPVALASAPEQSDLAGHIAESVLGAYLLSIAGLDVAHLPERGGEPEVDFVLTLGTRRIPIEVKYRRRIDPLRDTEGLRAFLETTVYNAPFGILVTQTDGVEVADPRIVALPLSSVLLVK